MDLSKLPKMSKTPAPPPAAPEPAPIAPLAQAGPQSGASDARMVPCPYCAAPLRASSRFCDNCGSPVRTGRDVGAGPALEAWISVGIGVLLLFIWPTMTKFAASKVFHTSFAPYSACDDAGTVIEGKFSDVVTVTFSNPDGTETVRKTPYAQTKPNVTPNFWNDLAITLFALALILEGVALVLSRKPMVVLFALVITAVATLLNLGYALETFSQYGLPIVSVLAVFFGGYMMMYQYVVFQSVRGRK